MQYDPLSSCLCQYMVRLVFPVCVSKGQVTRVTVDKPGCGVTDVSSKGTQGLCEVSLAPMQAKLSGYKAISQHAASQTLLFCVACSCTITPQCSCSVLLDIAMRAYVYYHAYCISNKKSQRQIFFLCFLPSFNSANKKKTPFMSQRYLIPPLISIYIQKKKNIYIYSYLI